MSPTRHRGPDACTTCHGYGEGQGGTTCPTCNGTKRAAIHGEILPTRPRQGRPSKVTTHGPAVLARIRKGMDDDAAANASNVDPTTVTRWLARGYDTATLEAEGYEVPESMAPYRAFLQEYLHAREALYESLLDRVQDLISTMQAREALGYLERIAAARFGRVDTLRIEREPGGSMPVTQRYAATIAELLRGIIADLQLNPEQLERCPEVVERNLQRVSAREVAS